MFSSITFLFYFLPLFLAAFYLTRCSKWVLAVFSILFYAWGEPVYVLLLLASILANFQLGLLIERSQGGSRRFWVTFGIVANLVPLIWVKYSRFALDTASELFGRGAIDTHLIPATLPLGVSFYTFHALSYLIDVYRRDTPAERSLRDMILYVSMFPQLVAGLLIRYKTIAHEIHRPVRSFDRTVKGVHIFIVGLAQKVLIANTLGGSADAIFALPPSELSGPLSWLGILCYTLQIYYDFGGYSNMAIGLASVIGFTFPRNFNYPYAAVSMTDFWRRWHMTLSAWFRDYVYIPLGGNRVSPARTYLNLAAVFLLCGLWHGAAWTFVVWGLAHGLFLVLERAGLDRVLAGVPGIVRHAYVLLVVMVTWVFFRADTLEHAWSFLAAMAGQGEPGPIAPPLQRFLGNDVLLALSVGVLTATPLGAKLAERSRDLLSPGRLRFAPVLELGSLACLFLFVSMSLAGGVYNPFIYFRF